MEHYGVPDFHTALEFLALLAQRQGKLRKGGLPDNDKAAKSVLMDWTGWVKTAKTFITSEVFKATPSLPKVPLFCFIYFHAGVGSATLHTLRRRTLFPLISVLRLWQRWAKLSTGRN